MPFLAYDLALEFVAALREPIRAIRKHSASEAKQLEEAANSVVRNLADGNGRFGRDRLHHFSIAYGSLLEARSSLDLALVHGWLPAKPPAYALARRLGGMAWRLMGR